jgi:hypothetical protein
MNAHNLVPAGAAWQQCKQTNHGLSSSRAAAAGARAGAVGAAKSKHHVTTILLQQRAAQQLGTSAPYVRAGSHPTTPCCSVTCTPTLLRCAGPDGGAELAGVWRSSLGDDQPE